MTVLLAIGLALACPPTFAGIVATDRSCFKRSGGIAGITWGIVLSGLTLLDGYSHRGIVLLIDEFSLKQPTDASKHISGPKSLLTLDRDYAERASIYAEAGENLYYYPLFLTTMLSYLQSLGYNRVAYNFDYKMKKIPSEEIKGKKSYCLTIFASRKEVPIMK